MRTAHALIVAAGTAVSVLPAHAQPSFVRTTRIAQGGTDLHWTEVAVIASPVDPNTAVAAFIRRITSSPTSLRVHVAATRDAWDSIAAGPTALTAPSTSCSSAANTVDPMVAASATTGDLYVGAFSQFRVFVQRMSISTLGLSDPVVAQGCLYGSTAYISFDKPFMAIGPWPWTDTGSHTVPEVLHAGFFEVGEDQASWYAATSVYSADESPIGMNYQDAGFDVIRAESSSTTASTQAIAEYPLVIPSGTHAGRLVMAAVGLSGTFPSNPSGTPPIVTYSDALDDATAPNGRRWEIKQVINLFGPSNNQQPIYLSSDATAYPSLSVDPNNTEYVYLAFVGSTASGGAADLFVARSATAGGRPQANVDAFLPENTVHISDSMIYPTATNEGATTEFNPSIVIDPNGGINILYSRYAPDVDHKVKVRVAHWDSFTSLKNHDTATVFSLSGSFNTWPYTGNDDYQMMCLAGCNLYAAYPTDESGTWDMYVSVLRFDTGICQPAATCYPNCDGSTAAPILNFQDFTCFLGKFASNDSYANCDASTTSPVLNVLDFTCFLQKYAAGCQ